MELALAPETLARWQFGITTVYHFLFVPLTISLAALTAILETAWVRTGKEHYLRATKFWGKLFLINIAMGVVTGIVQEFQFGMNWSDYSRFVGDVFGAPLAFEALIAFFFESTFIGLWIFGWDKLPKKVHLACIWVVSIGTILSAYFIMAANSFMQHPVGYRLVKKADGTMRAELTDFPKVLFQETALVNFWHVISASILVGGAFMTGIAVFHLRKKRHVRTMRMSLRLGLVTALVGTLLTVVSADTLGKVMYEQQPMKMSAAEALWDSQQPAPFSLFAYGDVAKGHNTVAIEIPGILSFLAKNDFNAKIPGINDINKSEQEKFGPGDYRPNIPTAYWAYRWMIGFGGVSMALCTMRPLADQAEVLAGAGTPHRGRGRPEAHAHQEHGADAEARHLVVAAVPVDVDLPAHRHLLGLDLHRDGASALGGVRPVEDQGRGLARGLPGGGADLADRVHPHLRDPRRHRGEADAQVREAGSAGAHRGRPQPAHQDRRRPP